MPADLSTYPRTSKLSRRLTDHDNIDLRRSKGEISCAECRRLKLKCDKKIPCSSCTRRGRHFICPNGILPGGQGTRPIATDTALLQAKITEMGFRIQQLEEALAVFQSGISSEPHPLLRDDLLRIKFAPRKHRTVAKEKSRENSSGTTDAPGISTVGDWQDLKYYDLSAARTEFMAGAEMDMSALEHDSTSRVSAEITQFSGFPFGTERVSLALILNYLPSQPRAWSLYETYLEHASWVFRPLKREEMIDEILSPVYKAMKDRQTSGSNAIESISPHKLAVLFLVFTLGALVDLTLEPYSPESETYYHLSCACLSLRSIFDSPEIATVQAVVLMATYHAEGGKKHTLDSAWALISLGAKLAQNIGLHRDGARFGMDAKTAERRRCLFWEMISTETFYCLALGRPPSIRLSYVDCQLPEDDQATMDENGNVVVGVYRWKYELMRDVLAGAVEVTLTTEAPGYQAILEMDRKVREKPLPVHLSKFLGSEQCGPLAYMQKCLTLHYRAAALMYIHRSFFAQAMLDHPDNPLCSVYALSFLAAYRSASSVIKNSLYHFERFPDLLPRVWVVWTSLFPAAIIVGCIVTRSPSSSMAPNAFIELGLVYDLFEKGATHSRRARDGLAVLSKLKEKAYQAYSQSRTGTHPASNESSETGKPDELTMFGGRTRIIVSKKLSCRSSTGSQSQFAQTSPPVQIGSDNDATLASAEQTPNVYPALMEYLSTLPSPDSLDFPDFDHQQDAALFSSLQYQEYTADDENQNNTQFYQWQSPSSTFSTPTPPPNYSSYRYPSSMAPFTHFVPETEYETTQSKNDFHQGNYLDLGMMITSDSNEQWTAFVQDTEFSGGDMQDLEPGSYDINEAIAYVL